MLALVIAGAVLFYLWRKKRNAAAAARQNEIGKGPHNPTRSSSTMRSDESDHPYENPSLGRNDPMVYQGSEPSNGHDAGPYASLKGQSLPHHYQGIGEKSTKVNSPPDDSVYDELMTSTGGTGSGYYFKLEPDGAQGSEASTMATGRDSILEDQDRPYDQIEIGNSSNNSNQNAGNHGNSTQSGEEKDNPYYFKVEKIAADSGNSVSTSNVSPHTKKNKTNRKVSFKNANNNVADDVRAKPPIAEKPNLASIGTSIGKSASYDRLDRSVLKIPHDAGDLNDNEYNKLLPRLASNQNHPPSGEDDRYMKVKVGNDFAQGVEVDDEGLDDNDYNKLNRGVEKDFEHLKDTGDLAAQDNETSEEVPVEL